ncbi:MAG: carboxypeptidase regulatory-like domain-containing protein [Candidatus Brocadiales bacterium]
MLNRLCILLAVLAQVIWTPGFTPCAQCEYEVIDVKDGCTISGSVRFVGDIPKPEMLVVDKDLHVCGMKTRPSNKLIIDENTRGIKNAVVYIENITRGKNFEEKWHYVMDQMACEFKPHVRVIPVNSTLEIRNSDPMAHNVHAYSLKNATFNESIPSRGRPLAKSFKLEEKIKIGCDRHRWMRAWVVVREDPYYDLTWFDGTFKITDVPPGDYKISVWHEAFHKEELAAQTQEVSLMPNQEIRLDFKLSHN